MATRKHILLVLPALLAALGGTQNSAYAGDGIGIVAADLIAAPNTIGVTPTTEPMAAVAPSQEVDTTANAAPQPDADEAIRRTVFEILAEARSRIGFLPDPAASPELVNQERIGAEEARTADSPRRAIFDILADARGDPRFLAKEAAAADKITSEPVADPIAEAGPPADATASVGNEDRPITAEAPHSTLERLAEARANGRVPAKGLLPTARVTTTLPPATAAWGSETEAEVGDAHRPSSAEAPEIRASMDEAPSPTPTVENILAEARGNPRFLVNEASAPDRLASEPSAHPAAEAALKPDLGTTAENTPSPAAAKPPHQTAIFEAIAEARGRIGFRPGPPPPEPELGRGEALGAGPSLATETPRRTIFDILAEARGNPRFLTPESSQEEVPGKRQAVETLATRSAHEAKAGDVKGPVALEPGAAQAGSAIPGQEPNVPIDGTASGVTPGLTTAAPAGEAPPPPRGASRNREAQEPAPAKPRSVLVAAAEVDSEKLDHLRGGFEGPGGLKVSFGIERMVVVNGVLQSSTQMRVNDVGSAVSGQPNPANVVPAPGMVTVVQNGVNNTTLANLPASALATVVQNSLDNQHLQTITRINAIVNSAEMLRTTRMQQSLQDSLNRAALAR